MKYIAKIKSDFPSKFGIPRQSGFAKSLRAEIIMEPEFRNIDLFDGIEEFSHLWILWEFSENVGKAWTSKVRPPKLGGNEKKGVFATRSPFRPNPIGLSCVEFLGIEVDEKLGPILLVAGADLMDGTPIYDIKPYIPYADCKTEASEGFTSQVEKQTLQIVFEKNLMEKIDPKKRTALIEVLEMDPRPGYQNDPKRIYGMPFGKWDIRFTVKDGILTVIEIVDVTEQ
ncbi:MAG: tRNA (N6-threonylcarbamoyladenosine(37)-N6)-methyltransferase TrmO [Eubacteriales bacterium]|nr:tRNA (N6-threonylcarbamoyladenosine(37)-N6)-methyltransferase TrmO [Eubacteriales bacterium]